MKDLARIYIKAGDGGDGSAHFHHGKYQPKGGPDGGDGGDGGDVILVADENIDNLVEFNYTKRYVVKDGEAGMEKKMHGKNTDPIEIKVPVGTVVYEISEEDSRVNLRDRESFDLVMSRRRMMVDMDTHGKRFEAAWGGRGGHGNWHFRSATNQTPKEFEKGRPGDEKWLLLEMKVVADVGIVGLPNVGKSSLLKALTNANPRIAGYPFTTLEPNLGVLKLRNNQAPNSNNQTNSNDQSTNNKNEKPNFLTIVDVPGVVEEAWEGKGIGPWFLRHLERTKTLVHVLAPEVNNQAPSTKHQAATQLANDYKTVRKELEKYGKGLVDKNEVVVINKMELIEGKDRGDIAKSMKTEIGKDVVFVSAGMGETGELVGVL